jgi:hypothetical protein
MARWAVVERRTGAVINVIEYVDGDPWPLPRGTSLVPTDLGNIGDRLEANGTLTRRDPEGVRVVVDDTTGRTKRDADDARDPRPVEPERR